MDEMPIENEILVMCVNPHEIPLQKIKGEVYIYTHIYINIYMQDDDAQIDKRGVRLPEVYAFVMATEVNEKSQTKNSAGVQRLESNDSYCHQASFTEGFPGST